MTTGQKIRNFRDINNLSQAKLGALLGVSAVMISQYENGKRIPKYETLCRIAENLHVKPDDLLGDDVFIADDDIQSLFDETYEKYRDVIEEWTSTKGYDFYEVNGNVYVVTEKGRYEFTENDLEMLQDNINFYLDQELKKKHPKIIVPYRAPENK